MRNEIDICYLCGENLNSDDIDKDHVPMKQIHASDIRKTHNLSNLLTLPTHKSCNHSYKHDEDYFVVTLAPLAIESYSGDAVLDDVAKQFKRPQGRRLGNKVLEEFGKITLPNGWVTKRFEGERISRILWKIVRGLFFHETTRFLPENTPDSLEIFSQNFVNLVSRKEISQMPPPLFSYVRDTPSRGQYPGIFDYKYTKFSANDKPHLWVWAVLLWDCIICMINFPDPESSMDECRATQIAGILRQD